MIAETPTQTEGITLRPGRLWNLWDLMQRFHANSFATAIGLLQRAGTLIGSAEALGAAPDNLADQQLVSEALRDAKKDFDEVPLSRVLRSQIERLESYAKTYSGEVLAMMLVELNNNIMVELSSAWFLMIDANHRALYEQHAPLFGSDVAAAFPEAGPDIAAAGRCYALDEWTACVFHLMRVLEHGLHTVADEVQLAPDAVAHENWKNVIDQVEKKIREMESLPKTSQKAERLQKLSAAAMQFRYFKDAWRNHVTHSRVAYDKHSCPPVFQHVMRFMIEMAA
jgi:hypothetical protein